MSRDYAAGATVQYKWTTKDVDRAPIAPSSAFDSSDIRIYKGSSATQRTSANGITVTSPFDSLTGVHHIAIDLSDNTDAGFYAAGNDYQVMLVTAKTVDGYSVDNTVLFEFSIANRDITANVTQLGGSTQSLTDLKDFADDGYDPSTNKVQGVVTTDTATAVTTVNGLAANVITATSIQNDAITAAKIANGAIDAATFAADVDAEFLSYIVDDATRIDASALNTATGTTIPAILDDTDLIDDGTSGLAKIATDVAAILVDTGTTLDGKINTIDGIVDDILVDTAVIGAAGAGLTALPWNASWDAEVQSEVDDALIAKGLDHLVFASVTGTDIADNSIIAKLVSKSATADWDTFVNTTDALEALRDNTGTAGAGLTAVVWNASWDAEVESEVTDALTAYGVALQSTVADIAINIIAIDQSLGAIDEHVDLILEDTGTTGVVVNTFTTAGKAEVQAEANDALVANNLDHLVLSAVDTDFATTVHVDSVIGQLAQTSDGGFSRADDSLEAIRDRGDAAYTTATGFAVPGDEMDLVDAPNATAITAIQSGLSVFNAGSDTVTVGANNDKTGYALSAAYDVYHADIKLNVDESNTQDEYTITWFKNGVRVTSGITSPTIQVVKRADGTDLIASTTPTQIASTGSYKHDATTTARMTAGQDALVIVGATIDGSARTFATLVGRDSSA